MKINIGHFLQSLFKNEKAIVYIPNPGNVGDSLIGLGTLHIFEKYGIKYTIGHHTKKYNNQILVYGGGGNLTGIWHDCENFLLSNHKNNTCIILPHTITNIDSLPTNPEIIKNVIFICRELVSFGYIKKFNANAYISHDMSFNINKSFLQQFCLQSIPYNETYCFRTDQEKLLDHSFNDQNNDISLTLRYPEYKNIHKKYLIESYVFFQFISKYHTIYTDRLHVAIAGSLLNKEVFLYPNIYFKNKAVFEFSLKNCINTKLVNFS